MKWKQNFQEPKRHFLNLLTSSDPDRYDKQLATRLKSPNTTTNPVSFTIKKRHTLLWALDNPNISAKAINTIAKNTLFRDSRMMALALFTEHQGVVDPRLDVTYGLEAFAAMLSLDPGHIKHADAWIQQNLGNAPFKNVREREAILQAGRAWVAALSTGHADKNDWAVWQKPITNALKRTGDVSRKVGAIGEAFEAKHRLAAELLLSPHISNDRLKTILEKGGCLNFRDTVQTLLHVCVITKSDMMEVLHDRLPLFDTVFNKGDVMLSLREVASFGRETLWKALYDRHGAKEPGGPAFLMEEMTNSFAKLFDDEWNSRGYRPMADRLWSEMQTLHEQNGTPFDQQAVLKQCLANWLFIRIRQTPNPSRDPRGISYKSDTSIYSPVVFLLKKGLDIMNPNVWLGGGHDVVKKSVFFNKAEDILAAGERWREMFMDWHGWRRINQKLSRTAAVASVPRPRM